MLPALRPYGTLTEGISSSSSSAGWLLVAELLPRAEVGSTQPRIPAAQAILGLTRVVRRGGICAWKRSGICVPFFLTGVGGNPSGARAHLLGCPTPAPALALSSRGRACRTSPHRAAAAPMRPTAAPPPAPAAPSPLGGPASSARCPPTLRSPPRPRGAANRAGERVTPLFLLEPPGPVAQRT